MDSPRDEEPRPLDEVDEAVVVTEVTHYRRPLLGIPWVAAALVVPALLAGLGVAARPGPSTAASPAATASSAASAAGTAASAEPSGTPAATPSTASPSPTPTKEAAAPLLQLAQDRSTVTVSGDVPDAATGASVVALLQAGYGSGVTVVNKLKPNPAAPAVDAGTFGALSNALKGSTGIILDAQGKAVRVSGIVGSADAKKALVASLKKAYPKAEVDATRLAVGDATKPPASCEATASYVRALTTASRIQFSRGTLLTKDSAAELGKIAAAVKKCPDLKLKVAGNTDDRGADATNQRLSLQRAAVVKGQLVKAGVPAKRITAVGNGEKSPIANNATAAGQLMNRRVDVTVE